MRNLSVAEMHCYEGGAVEVPGWIKCAAAALGAGVSLAGFVVAFPVAGFFELAASYALYALAVDTVASWC